MSLRLGAPQSRPKSSSRTVGRRPPGGQIRRSIDLTPIRQRLGDHWDRYADSIYAITERTITKSLGATENCIRTADGFDIWFDRATPDTANHCIDEISAALDALFFGDGKFDELALPRRRSPGRRRVRRGLLRRLADRLRALSRRGRGRSRRGIGPDAAPALQPSENDGEWQSSAATRHAALDARLSDDLAEMRMFCSPAAVGKWARTTPIQVNPEPIAQIMPNLRPPGVQSGLPPTPEPDELFSVNGPRERFLTRKHSNEIARLEQGIASAVVRAARRQLGDPSRLQAELKKVQITYRPLWNVGMKKVNLFRTTPILSEETGLLIGDAIYSHLRTPEAAAVLDQLLVSHVMLDCADAKPGKDIVGIVLPLRFTTLVENWSSEPLFETLSRISRKARRPIIIEIADARDGRTDSRFPAAVRQIKKRFGRAGARLPVTTQDMRYLKEAGFDAVSTDVSSWGGTEEDLIAELEYFFVSSKQLGIRAAVHGLRTRSLILAAATMGFDAIHGPLITHQAWSGLFETQSLELADLYADIVDPHQKTWKL